ncbi:MAG: DUF6391 domain-containing protein [Caldilineales bacterium]|nr:DUF6391 domain-containing protein [Caldilineales bacterium]MDW8317032.1 DUF6391 domain-containing protein [Anaerolineae bacterium]
MSHYLRHLVRRVRQNHGLEHATITLLMQRHRHLALVAGRSNHRGFFVYGDVDTDALAQAAQTALARLQQGDAHLAIHPNCGTNLVTMGALSGAAALLTAAVGQRHRLSWLDQFPVVVLSSVLALVVGRPLGMALQRHVTTSADAGNLRLGAISRWQLGRLKVHFVRVEETAEAAQ